MAKSLNAKKCEDVGGWTKVGGKHRKRNASAHHQLLLRERTYTASQSPARNRFDERSLRNAGRGVRSRVHKQQRSQQLQQPSRKITNDRPIHDHSNHWAQTMKRRRFGEGIKCMHVHQLRNGRMSVQHFIYLWKHSYQNCVILLICFLYCTF